ncbi:hypothetical protein ACVWWO_004382 [Bradyrhizobium sp. F1.13.1]
MLNHHSGNCRIRTSAHSSFSISALTSAVSVPDSNACLEAAAGASRASCGSSGKSGRPISDVQLWA